MANLNSKELKMRSRDLLARTRCNYQKLVLIYSGAFVLLAFVSSALQLYLDQQIGTTGGLSGLGLRTVLQTVESVLGYVNMLFGPFWTAGFLSCIIALVRDQDPKPVKLLDGTKKFGRILGYQMYQVLIMTLVATLATYSASFLFLLTPKGEAFAMTMELLISKGSLITAEGVVNVEAIPTELLMDAALPLTLIFAAIFVPLYTWIGYHLRMTPYILMDAPRISALTAMLFSVKMMKGHKLQILKLDLSYWWYYGLNAIIAVVAYLDLILAAMGIVLPFDRTVAYFVTLIVYCVLSLGLDLWLKARVETTYVLAFEDIAHPDGKGIPLE